MAPKNPLLLAFKTLITFPLEHGLEIVTYFKWVEYSKSDYMKVLRLILKTSDLAHALSDSSYLMVWRKYTFMFWATLWRGTCDK